MADIREIAPLHPSLPVRRLDKPGERRKPPEPRDKQAPPKEQPDDDEDKQHIDDYA